MSILDQATTAVGFYITRTTQQHGALAKYPRHAVTVSIPVHGGTVRLTAHVNYYSNTQDNLDMALADLRYMCKVLGFDCQVVFVEIGEPVT